MSYTVVIADDAPDIRSFISVSVAGAGLAIVAEVGIHAGVDYFMAKPFSPRDRVPWLAVGKEDR